MELTNLSIDKEVLFPKISLITINYRQVDVTLQFLESTKLLTYPNYEIIVVDNGCLEDSSNVFLSKFPKIKYKISKENLGFAGANNLGMSLADGDYFFIVNNDTEVTPNLLDELIKPFYKYKDVGAVSPKIRYFHQPNIIQYAGFTKVNPITGRNKVIGYREFDSGQYENTIKTAYAHGAAMLVKRSVVDKIGGFNEDYFMYYEELDWSGRMIKNGYTIYYVPLGIVYHKVSMSVGKNSPFKTYYLSRNRILFMRRSYSGGYLLVFYLYLVVVTIPFSIIRYVLKKDFSHIKPFFKGVIWNLFHSAKNTKELS